MQIIKRTQNEIQINVFGVLELVCRKAWIILLVGLLCGGLTYSFVYFFIIPQYTASATFYVNNSASGDNTSSITSSDLTASASLVNTYAAIITSNTVLDKVIEQSGINSSAEELAEIISAEAINSTEVFRISVTSTDPEEAALIVNTIAKIIPEQIAEIVEGSSVKVVDYAKVPTEQSSPDYVKCSLIGLILGVIFSIVVILTRELMDTRVRRESDLEDFDIPILGVVPEFDSAVKLDHYGYR